MVGRKDDLFGEYSSTRPPQACGLHIERAHAKVNLVLYVGSRRADGYHPVATILQTLALHDTVRIAWKDVCCDRTGAMPEIRVTSDDPTLPVGLNNLAGRAASTLTEAFRRRRLSGGMIEIRILKRIPVAAGLAGGSADAAAVLRGLNTGLGLGLNAEELGALGAKIGSDIPACVHGGTLYCRGRGELVTPLEAGRLWWVLVNPGGGLGAKEVYQAFDDHFDTERGCELEQPVQKLLPGIQEALLDADPARLAPFLVNDLELPVALLDSTTSKLRGRLASLGSNAVLVSGSGPTVAALVAGPDQAHALAERIRPDVPWVWWGPSQAPGSYSGDDGTWQGWGPYNSTVTNP